MKLTRIKRRAHRRRCNVNARRWHDKENFFRYMAARVGEAEAFAKKKRWRYGKLKKRRLELERRALECASKAQDWEKQR